MNIESQQYRDDLANEIKEIPKEDHKEVLEKSKETPEYWQARTEKIKERQDEEKVDDGLGVFVKKKTLYRGSNISGIIKFDKAQEFTIGTGVYFTSEAKSAIGYAHRRSYGGERNYPVIYESSVENMKFLDLRNDENVKKVLAGFRLILLEKQKNDPYYQDPIRKDILFNAISEINHNRINHGNLRNVTYSLSHIFSDFVQSLGYDGLISEEGGEGDIGNHDSFVVFDPEKINIIKEQKVN